MHRLWQCGLLLFAELRIVNSVWDGSFELPWGCRESRCYLWAFEANAAWLAFEGLIYLRQYVAQSCRPDPAPRLTCNAMCV